MVAVEPAGVAPKGDVAGAADLQQYFFGASLRLAISNTRGRQQRGNAFAVRRLNNSNHEITQ